MGVKELPVRKEVFEGIDPAPKLGKILDVLEGGKADDVNTEILSNPREFFKRTFITENMLELFERVVEGFEGKQNKVFVLYSFYGGGKTHTLLALIHAFRNPDILTDPEVVRGLDASTISRLEHLADRIKKISAEIVTFSGDSSKYSGSPLNPVNAGSYTFRTVWGYLAHKLGKYYEFKNFDEKISAPQQDVIERMLSGARALIVFDELSDYLMNLVGGEYREYARAVVNFIEYFIQAIKSSRCVAVITLPVDAEGRADWRYEGEEVIQSLWDALKENAVLIEPLRSGEYDIVNVLRKRLFEEIPEKVKEKAIQKIKDKVENYLNYFGSKEYVKEVEAHYPFSPEYVRLLQELILRTGMQKTRDALMISMRVLREIHASDNDPDLIMPWHINLSWFDRAFLGGLSEYKQIYVRQVESFPDSPYGELPKYILRTIFIATYHYDSAAPQEHFPGRMDIVRMAYEPATFSANNLEVPDIDNAINYILSSPDVTHLNEKDDKFWFWRLPNIKEYIQRKAERIFRDEDPRIYEKIKEFVNYALEGNLERFAKGMATTKKGRKPKTAKVEHYFEEFHIIDDYGKYPEDSPRLKLAILLRPDLVSEVENIFDYVEEGKQRSYRNTIAVLSPVGSQNYSPSDPDVKAYKELMMHASVLLAVDEVLEEITIYYGDYGAEAVEAQKSIVERERRAYTQKLAENIPRVFSYVFFNPTNAEGITCEKIVNPGFNLAFNVHETLRTLQKIVEEMDFDYFVTLIQTEMGIDLETDEKMRTVGQIVSWFLQNPRFPMTKEKVIKDTIAKGVRLLRIGLVRTKGEETEVYFKPVHHQVPVAKDTEGVIPSEIKDTDGVVSKIRAIRDQFNILKSRQTERVLPTHVERIYYVVYPELGGECYTLEQLETMPDWEEIFLSGVIVRKVEKIDYDLLVEIYPSKAVAINEGEVARFTIQARPINLNIDGVKVVIKNKRTGNVILEEDMELVQTEKGKAYRFEFEVDPESKRDEYLAEIIAIGEQELEKKETLVVSIREKERVFTTDVISLEHVGYNLVRIDDIEDFDVLEEIKNSILALGRDRVNGRVSGRVKVRYAGGEMELNVRNMELDVGIEASIELAMYGEEREIVGKYWIEFENAVLDELTIRKLESLNKKVKFTLRSETQ